MPFSHKSSRNYFQEKQDKTKTDDPKDKARMRRMKALGGGLIFMWIPAYGILLYTRRTEHRELDQKLPPIPWDEFSAKYFVTRRVKSIVCQPQLGTGNVYVHSENERQIKNRKELLHIFKKDSRFTATAGQGRLQ